MNTKVAIVEDNSSMREGLAALIRMSNGYTLVGACRNGDTAVRDLPAVAPDVVLMDINMPGISGIETLRQLRVQLPKLKAIMLTVATDSRHVFSAFESGADGYLVKDTEPSRILEAIKEVEAGGSPISSPIARLLVQKFHQQGTSAHPEENLTPREEEILNCLARGFRAKEIADELGISIHTVQTHVRKIYSKMQVRSGAEAVAKFLTHGGTGLNQG